jgi:hypothetical protein
MALITTNKLYIDVDKGVAYKRWNDFTLIDTPVFYSGDIAQFELYLVRVSNNSSYPMDNVGFPGSAIYASIGTPGADNVLADGQTWSAISAPSATYSAPLLTIPSSAVSGYITLTLSNSSPSLSKTTLPISLKASATDVESAIETAVNSVSGWSAADALVEQTGAGKYSVTVSATNTSTVYSLTVAVTSYLTGVSGYLGIVNIDATNVDTALGSNTEITSTFEVKFRDSSTEEAQTYLQIPCLLRAAVFEFNA